MKTTKNALFTLITILALVLTACGGDDTGPDSTNPPTDGQVTTSSDEGQLSRNCNLDTKSVKIEIYDQRYVSGLILILVEGNAEIGTKNKVCYTYHSKEICGKVNFPTGLARFSNSISLFEWSPEHLTAGFPITIYIVGGFLDIQGEVVDCQTTPYPLTTPPAIVL